MQEDVNVKIIRKINDSKYSDNIKEFLIKLIREEFANYDLLRWAYSDFYDGNIKDYCEEEETNGNRKN